MNKSLLSIVFCCIVGVAVRGKITQTSSAVVPGVLTPSGTANYAVVERGVNHRVWQKVTWETNALGNVLAHPHQYTELASGLHYLKDGQWVESKEEIVPTTDGAAATNGNHQAFFPPNLFNGAIKVVTPDGKELRSRVLGLAYLDTASGSNVLIAELKSCPGVIVPPNQVIYPDAFDGGFRADVRLRYTRAGFEQDIILHEEPPSPAQWGLNPKTTRLQVLTEFLNNPTASVSQKQTADGTVDSVVDFGQMKIGPGKAFMIGNSSSNSPSAAVDKHWQQYEGGRQFLVEEVKMPEIESQLKALPVSAALTNVQAGADGILHRVFAQRKLPPPASLVENSGEKMKVASLSSAQKGYVLDYVIFDADQDFTFQADTTYLIDCERGGFYVSGSNAIQAGAVIKFRNISGEEADGALSIDGQFVCQTSPDHPAIFTSSDDDSRGETVDGSSGNPVMAAEGSAYIHDELMDLSNCRFCYAYYALNTVDAHVRDCEFINCHAAFLEEHSGNRSIVLHNVLFGACDRAIVDGAYSSIKAENLTADISAWSDCNLFLTNSIIKESADLPAGATTNHVVINPSGVVFQSGPLGDYYLVSGSAYVDAGETTADRVGLYHYTTQTNQVKEGGSIVDLGYHYVAVDGYGNPIDTNGDGMPDYLQDSNGNGIFDIGEISDWQTYNSGSGLTGGNGLVVFTPLK